MSCAYLARNLRTHITRKATVLALVFMVSGLTTSTVRANSKLTDDEIRQAILGSWVNPADSPDFRGEPGREVFRADGTYVYYLYTSRECQTVLREVRVKWRIENGILTSIAPNGLVMRDEVIAIERGRMTLRSLEDHSVYFRDRSETCFQAGS